MHICVSVYACKITLMWIFLYSLVNMSRQNQFSTAKAKPVQVFQTKQVSFFINNKK